jgi:hypothetical protein
MGIGFNTLRRFSHIENEAASIGFRFGEGYGYSDDLITLYPAENEALPIYARDASIFSGDIYQVEKFLVGWRKSREYLKILGATSDKIIQRKEQDVKNGSLLKTLKTKA